MMQNRSHSVDSDDRCTLQSDSFRLQDLSIQHARAAGVSGSVSPPPPAPLAARRDERSSSEPTTTTTSSSSVSSLRLSPFKRKHKRASLSPSAKKKTSLSDIVVAEGELVVAEERYRSGGSDHSSVVLRTLGSIFCVLVVKNSAALHLETISEHRHHRIDVDVAQTELESLDPNADAHARKFRLRFRLNTLDQPAAYVFECSTSAQYSTWVDAIVGFYSSNSNSQATRRPIGTSASSHSASRSIQSTAPPCSNGHPPALLPGPCSSSFLYTVPPRTTHVLLVRHGHYINAHARGVADAHQVLSHLGRQQAAITGTYLEQLYARAPTRRHDLSIAHSDLTRAVETAQAIAKHFSHCGLHATRLLREGWPGRPYSYSSHLDAPAAAAAAARSHDELARIDVERMELAFQTFFMQSRGSRDGVAAAAVDPDASSSSSEEQLRYHVIVCHANLIRYFLCRAMGTEAAGHWGHFEINHCGVTRIDVGAHRPLKIVSVNETGHLPHSLITSSEDHL